MNEGKETAMDAPEFLAESLYGTSAKDTPPLRFLSKYRLERKSGASVIKLL